MLAGEGRLHLAFQRREVDPQQPFEEPHAALHDAIALGLAGRRLHRERAGVQLLHDGLPQGQHRGLVVRLDDNGAAVPEVVDAFDCTLHCVRHVGADALDGDDPHANGA